MTSTTMTQMRIEVMGCCRIRGASDSVTPTPGASALLSILADQRGRPVAVDGLRRVLWVSPPDSAVSLIRGYIRELRAALRSQAEAVETIHAPRGHTGAYRLTVPADVTDVGRFRRIAIAGDRAAREGHQLGALAWYRDALAVWPGGDIPHLVATPQLKALARSWRQDRAGLVERYAAAAVAAGIPDHAAAEVATLHRSHPDRAQTAQLYQQICK